MTIQEYETRKLHVSVPLEIYDFLSKKRLFKEIDGVVVKLLMEHYNIE